MALLLGACNRREAAPTAASSAAPAASAASATGAADLQRWLGVWRGPEGTSLDLVGVGSDGFQVAVRNLDGVRHFKGSRVGDTVRFERDGVTESIRAGTGAETGMKWLAGKSDCLVVKAGEGYCRP